MSETRLHGDEQKTFGSRLREVRERKGLSLEDVARTTRITKGYLKALEEGDNDKLPSEAYAKGFLRVYAQFLNMPEEDVTGLLEHCSAGRRKTGEQGASNPTHCCSALSPPAQRVWKAMLPFLFLIFIVVSIVFFFSSAKELPAPQLVTVNEKSLAEKVVVASVQEESTVSPDEEPLPPAQTISAQVTTGGAVERGDRFVLSLRVLEDGALDITIDETTKQHYDLKAGDLIEWTGEKYCALDLENAGGVEAELNGKLLKPFGKKGSPAHIVLSAGYDGEIAER